MKPSKLTPASFLKQDITRQFNLNSLYICHKCSLPESGFNPYDAALLQKLLEETDNNLAYGGYGEDRKDVWAKTYLKETGKFIHLGVDINCAAFSRVYAPFDGKIIHSFADDDRKMGWGGCLVLYRGGDYYWILAHLDPLALPKNGKVEKGQPISLVGTWPHNGNTFNHLHVQVARAVYDDMSLLDGYGTIEDLTNNINPFSIEV